MDFKQLRSFVAVADCGSFTQAAAQLYTSQPTISAHIRQLEEELQQRLFLRTTKSLSITPHGRELYDYAVQVLSLQDRLLAGWRQGDSVVSLGASTIPSAYLLPDLLARFSVLHPDISFDKGFNVLTGETAKAQNMPLAALLQSHPLLLREEGSGSQRSADDFLRAAGLEPDALHVAARLNDQESIKNLVAAGLGLAIVSAVSVARERDRGDLLLFPLADAARTFYVVTRRHDFLSPAARQFFDFSVRFYTE